MYPNPLPAESLFLIWPAFPLRKIEGRPPALFYPDLETVRKRLSFCKSKNVHEIYEDIFRGGMPKLRTTDLDRDRFYMDYVNTYIERDVKDLAQVEKLNEFYDFLVYMAARTGQELKLGRRSTF